MTSANPVLVELTRAGAVESVHHGRAVIVDAGARIVASWGDIESPVFPRSAVKSLQAIPFIESGAVEAFGLGDREIALACASHTGVPAVTERVAAWLDKIGLSEADLECGAHPPTDSEARAELIRRGLPPSQLHNNCSGKHAGMLSTAKHKGEPTRGYIQRGHPVQQRIIGVLEMMTGHDLSGNPVGVDGCGIPTLGIPLGALAFAMARLADPRDLPTHRAEVVRRILAAWEAFPELIAGEGRYDTIVMRQAKGRALVKSGAEGVCCAVVPGLGLGIALKIDDGAGRAVEPAMTALLHICKALDEDVSATVPLKNVVGKEVGEMRPVFVDTEGKS